MLLAALLTLSVFPATAFAQITDGETTGGQESVSYIDASGAAHEHEAAAVTPDSVVWENGWYAVTENTVISDRVTCTGDVNLILCDGATLTANAGIAVNEGNSLTVYGQSEGTGSLTIDIQITDLYDEANNNAAIGGEKYNNSGAITFNGGVINVTSRSMYGAAIGGGRNGDGYVTVNGGTVNATISGSASVGAAIGGGYNGGNDSLITINGGNVTATVANKYSSGIGGAYNQSAGVVINGGNVSASSIGSNGGGTVKLSWTNAAGSIYAGCYR